MDALLLIASVVGVGAIFVVTIGVVERLFGAGYGRRGRLPPRVVEIVSVVAAFAAISLVLVAFVWLRWL